MCLHNGNLSSICLLELGNFHLFLPLHGGGIARCIMDTRSMRQVNADMMMIMPRRAAELGAEISGLRIVSRKNPFRRCSFSAAQHSYTLCSYNIYVV